MAASAAGTVARNRIKESANNANARKMRGMVLDSVFADKVRCERAVAAVAQPFGALQFNPRTPVADKGVSLSQTTLIG